MKSIKNFLASAALSGCIMGNIQAQVPVLESDSLEKRTELDSLEMARLDSLAREKDIDSLTQKYGMTEALIKINERAGFLEDHSETLNSVFKETDKYMSVMKVDDEKTQKTQAIRNLDNIFYILKIKGVKEDYEKNIPFNESLRTKRFGNQNHVALYLAIAEKENLPIKAAKIGKHFFVRWYFDENNYTNWETSCGIEISDAEYEKQIKGEKIKNVSKRDLIAMEYDHLKFYSLDQTFEFSSQNPEGMRYISKDKILKAKGDSCDLFGNSREAIKKYSEAIKSNSSFAEAYNSRGLMQYRKAFEVIGDRRKALYEKAMDDYNKAIKLDSKNPLFYMNRAAVLKEMSKKENVWEKNDYSKAKKDFLKGLAIKSKR